MTTASASARNSARPAGSAPASAAIAVPHCTPESCRPRTYTSSWTAPSAARSRWGRPVTSNPVAGTRTPSSSSHVPAAATPSSSIPRMSGEEAACTRLGGIIASTSHSPSTTAGPSESAAPTCGLRTEKARSSASTTGAGPAHVSRPARCTANICSTRHSGGPEASPSTSGSNQPWTSRIRESSAMRPSATHALMRRRPAWRAPTAIMNGDSSPSAASTHACSMRSATARW